VTDYLTRADVLAIHQDLIERYGGSAGLRDPGLLEGAIVSPCVCPQPGPPDQRGTQRS